MISVNTAASKAAARVRRMRSAPKTTTSKPNRRRTHRRSWPGNRQRGCRDIGAGSGRTFASTGYLAEPILKNLPALLILSERRRCFSHG
jgi:hypothetical protein